MCIRDSDNTAEMSDVNSRNDWSSHDYNPSLNNSKDSSVEVTHENVLPLAASSPNMAHINQQQRQSLKLVPKNPATASRPPVIRDGLVEHVNTTIDIEMEEDAISRTDNRQLDQLSIESLSLKDGQDRENNSQNPTLTAGKIQEEVNVTSSDNSESSSDESDDSDMLVNNRSIRSLVNDRIQLGLDTDAQGKDCLLYTSPSQRDLSTSSIPSSA